jgi:site-specific recombinase XerD
MIEDLRIRKYSPRTVATYVFYVEKFAKYFRRSPELLGPKEIHAYQVYLVNEKHASWTTLNQTVCALRFLYGTTLGRRWVIQHIPYPRRERKLPVVLSRSEIQGLFAHLKNLKHLAILMVAYSGGLRVSEVLGLRVCDIDSKRMVLHVRSGKGRKDRFVPLSSVLLDVLRRYWLKTQPPDVLFPGREPEKPMSPMAVAAICRKAALKAGIQKRVTPHVLRHTFATHHLEAGTDVRTLQMILGHSHLGTTSLYLHVSTEKIQAATSPLDTLGE